MQSYVAQKSLCSLGQPQFWQLSVSLGYQSYRCVLPFLALRTFVTQKTAWSLILLTLQNYLGEISSQQFFSVLLYENIRPYTSYMLFLCQPCISLPRFCQIFFLCCSFLVCVCCYELGSHSVVPAVMEPTQQDRLALTSSVSLMLRLALCDGVRLQFSNSKSRSRRVKVNMASSRTDKGYIDPVSNK